MQVKSLRPQEDRGDRFSCIWKIHHPTQFMTDIGSCPEHEWFLNQEAGAKLDLRQSRRSEWRRGFRIAIIVRGPDCVTKRLYSLLYRHRTLESARRRSKARGPRSLSPYSRLYAALGSSGSDPGTLPEPSPYPLPPRIANGLRSMIAGSGKETPTGAAEAGQHISDYDFSV